jgi:predicted DNA-binding protein with PD1-like motif
LARREYRRIAFDEPVEVLALTGNIAATQRGATVDARVIIGRADGSAHGGHLLEARVHSVLEVVATEVPAHVRRTLDPATGLLLIDRPEKTV